MDEYLISVEELENLMQESGVILLDTRDPPEYADNHLPGAIHVPDIFTYLSTADNGGYEAMATSFSNIFSKAGVDKNKPVVVYEDAMDNGYGRSCRGWFLLKYMGCQDVHVLHGGYQAWLKRNNPVTKEILSHRKIPFIADRQDQMILTSQEMLAAINDPAIQIVDCRDYAEWIGANSSPYGYDYCPRKGRIPNAIWLEWYKFMTVHDGIPWFCNPQEIRDICEQAGINSDQSIYLYCFKGARTSNTLIALKYAGYKNVRNYFSSWNEWSRNPELPIDEGYPKTRLSHQYSS